MAKGRRKGFVTRSSAPYEAPAVQTGRLRGNLTSVQEGKLERRVGTSVEYAAPLEFGTSRMAPRPFIRPALKTIMGERGEYIIARQLGRYLGKTT